MSNEEGRFHITLYVTGVRVSPAVYRFTLPEGTVAEDVIFMMSGGAGVLTPEDYQYAQTGTALELKMARDVPMAGGLTKVFGYIPPRPKPRGQPRKAN